MGRGTRAATTTAPAGAQMGSEELRQSLRRSAAGQPSWISRKPDAFKPSFAATAGGLRRLRDLLARTGASYVEVVATAEGDWEVQFDDESQVTDRYRLSREVASGQLAPISPLPNEPRTDFNDAVVLCEEELAVILSEFSGVDDIHVQRGDEATVQRVSAGGRTIMVDSTGQTWTP